MSGGTRILPQTVLAHPMAMTARGLVTPVYEAAARGRQLGGLSSRGENCPAKTGQAGTKLRLSIEL